MKCIISVNNDNSIIITHPIEHERIRLNMSEQEYLDFVIAKDVPHDRPYYVREENALPQDKAFRNAWEWNGLQIVVNYTKAVEIRAEQLESARNQKIETLTEKIQIAEDDGLSSTELRNQRKQARDLDLTNALNGVSIQDLKTYVPPELR